MKRIAQLLWRGSVLKVLPRVLATATATVGAMGAMALLTMPPAVLAQALPDVVVSASQERTKVHLRKAAFREASVNGFFALPQLRIYNASGQQVFDMDGSAERGSSDRLEVLLRKSLSEPVPNGSLLTLEEEVARLEDQFARPFVLSAKPMITVIKYEAGWCAPCHTQSRVLSRVLLDLAGTPIRVVQVQTEPRSSAFRD